MNFGDFDQCLDTQHSFKDGQLKGQYCMIFYKYTNKLNNVNIKKSSLSNVFNVNEM